MLIYEPGAGLVRWVLVHPDRNTAKETDGGTDVNFRRHLHKNIVNRPPKYLHCYYLATADPHFKVIPP